MTPTTPKKLTMEERFEVLEKRIISVMTFGIAAMGVVVAMLGIFIAVLSSNQNKQAERLSELSEVFAEDKKQLDGVKDDFGNISNSSTVSCPKYNRSLKTALCLINSPNIRKSPCRVSIR